jgi:AcrR family transcriptional regulator
LNWLLNLSPISPPAPMDRRGHCIPSFRAEGTHRIHDQDWCDRMDRRPEIYEKAMELFSEHGYDHTPISFISKALGLSKAALYHYLPSKEYLLYRTHKYFIEKNLIPIVEKAEKISSPMERIPYFSKHFTKSLLSDHSARLLIREAHRLSPEHLSEIKTTWRRVFDLIRNAIRELEGEGKTIDVNANIATFAFIGMISWVIFWHNEGRRKSADSIGDSFGRLILHGLLKKES